MGFLSSIKGGLVTSYCHTGFGVSTVLLVRHKHTYTSISNVTGLSSFPWKLRDVLVLSSQVAEVLSVSGVHSGSCPGSPTSSPVDLLI